MCQAMRAAQPRLPSCSQGSTGLRPSTGPRHGPSPAQATTFLGPRAPVLTPACGIRAPASVHTPLAPWLLSVFLLKEPGDSLRPRQVTGIFSCFQGSDQQPSATGDGPRTRPAPTPGTRSQSCGPAHPLGFHGQDFGRAAPLCGSCTSVQRSGTVFGVSLRSLAGIDPPLCVLSAGPARSSPGLSPQNEARE